MRRRLLTLVKLPIAALAVAIVSCGDRATTPTAGGSGGAVIGSGSGGFSGKGTPPGAAGALQPTPTACGTGPIDVGRIGGPGRDGSHHRWTVSLGDTSSPRLAADADGNLIVGLRFSEALIGDTPVTAHDEDDFLLVKLDAAGELLWHVHAFDTPSAEIARLATDSAGNVFVAGSFSGTLSIAESSVQAATGPSATFRDAFSAKLGPDGTLLWLQRFGDGNDQAALGLVVSEDDHPIVAGSFGGVLSFGGEELVSSRGSFGFDIFVAELDTDGGHVASKAIGEIDDELLTDLGRDEAGNLYAYGTRGVLGSNRTLVIEDLILYALDPAFEPMYERVFAAPSVVAGRVAPAADGSVVITGNNYRDLRPSSDAGTQIGTFVAKLDADGAVLWQRTFDDRQASIQALALDPTGAIILTGAFSSIDFGGGALSSAGGTDVFLAKLDAEGEHLWSQRAGSCSDDYGWDLALGADGDVYLSGKFATAIDFGKAPVRSDGRASFVARLAP